MSEAKQMTAARFGRVAGALLITLAALLVSSCQSSGANEIALGQSLTKIEVKLDDLAEQQESLSTQMSQLSTTLPKQVQNSQAMTQTDLQELLTQVRDQKQALDQILQYVETLAAQKQIGGGGGYPTEPANGTPSPTPTPGPGQTGDASYEAYSQGVKAFNAGDYRIARESFRSALELGAGGDLEVECMYFIARTSQQLGEYEVAISQYTDLIRKHNTHRRAWESLEALGDIYLELGEPDRARQLWQSIVDSHPNYHRMNEVKRRLDDLGTN